MQNRNNSNPQKITPESFGNMNTEEKILNFSAGLLVPSGISQKEALANLLQKMDTAKPAKIRNIKLYFQAAAAVFVLLIGFSAVFSAFSKSTERTNFAEQSEITLPDGTKAVLNADTKISWSAKHFADERKLTLKGEAYFDVVKGTRFLIETKSGMVEILGTQLNIFSRNNEFRVSCITGKVKVTSVGDVQIITPGEIAELTEGGLVKNQVSNIGENAAWKQGVFYFEDKPVVSIFAELERQFDVSVEFENLDNRFITVTFSNKSLKEALDVICIPMELKYEIDHKKVRIYEKAE